MNHSEREKLARECDVAAARYQEIAKQLRGVQDQIGFKIDPRQGEHFLMRYTPNPPRLSLTSGGGLYVDLGY